MSTYDEIESTQSPEPTSPPEDAVQILDTDGSLLPGAKRPDLTDEELLEMYEELVLARRFDERATGLQRQGRISTYAPMRGQEGSQVATSFALDAADWLVPTYRDHAAKHAHGRSYESLLQHLAGYREGYAVPDDVNALPEYIPIGTQVPQAMGLAWGFTMQDQHDRAVLCHFGDGATSTGDFHEGLNFAAVYDVPSIFVCNNNQWAISMPFESQTATETIVEKADAYGVEGVRVDGTDPLAVYAVTRAAVQKAKHPAEGERRPTLIESCQYRLGAHSTADDPSAYRDEDDGEDWEDRDPVERLERYLYREEILDDDLADEIADRVEDCLATAIERAEATETDPGRMFEHVYEEPTDRLREQLADLDGLRERHGDEAFEEVGE
ncbi:pyruvate dehydrogenase (acetyl-transferring) E1 component subunit alpha [Halovivax asiaticus JCM 14624]|uniref:Pyruvate dehydrogenase (Acetyl-transferring) E1 component subunit alpha n=1 Tax=Halovivax asiaticus JCM 14624 TaxID=1227490 RepID=M0BKI3_9EURY|nr:thiamine pyrophosphate-dependent enzyme [Halovivax asiaticus]ELZ10818.1 pyruvate dehydrogenase (acetyl-transferring) E1 component subunit alpha [Halovivax asiaticus JCM 14624]